MRDWVRRRPSALPSSGETHWMEKWKQCGEQPKWKKRIFPLSLSPMGLPMDSTHWGSSVMDIKLPVWMLVEVFCTLPNKARKWTKDRMLDVQYVSLFQFLIENYEVFWIILAFMKCGCELDAQRCVFECKSKCGYCSVLSTGCKSQILTILSPTIDHFPSLDKSLYI